MTVITVNKCQAPFYRTVCRKIDDKNSQSTGLYIHEKDIDKLPEGLFPRKIYITNRRSGLLRLNMYEFGDSS